MLDLTAIPRVPTALTMFRLFLPDTAIELLANSATDTIAATRNQQQLRRDRHYQAVSGEEILVWIAQRLQFSLDIKSNIHRAYNEV